MRPVLAALLLIACGGGSGGSVSTSSSPSGPLLPGGCVRRCEELKPALIRDFGVSNVTCGTAEQWGATTDAECDCIFTRQFGVLVNGRSCSPK